MHASSRHVAGAGHLSTRLAVALVATLAMAACNTSTKDSASRPTVKGGGAPLAVVYAAGAPTQIRVLSGGNQFATPGQPFASPLVFEVDDAADQPVPGVTVTATVSVGTGTIAPASVVTDARGRGQVSVTAGGLGQLDVLLETVGATTTVGFWVNDAAYSFLQWVDGNEMWAAPGQPFTRPAMIRLVDASLNPISGGNVTFAASSADIVLSAASAITDAAGIASVDISAAVGALPGWYSVTCSSPIAFTDKVLYPSVIDPTKVGYLQVVSGGGQSAFTGTAFDQPLVVRLSFFNGSPVPGAVLTFVNTGGFAAGATLGTATGTTDGNGEVSIPLAANSWPGSYTVDVLTDTTVYNPIPADFHVPFTNLDRPLHGAATTMAVQSGGGQAATNGAAFGLPLTVKVTDADGVAVDGVEVTFTAPVSGAGASLSAATATTNFYGLASVTATANLLTGSYDVEASAVGLAVAPFHLTNLGLASTTALGSSLNPSTYGDAVTFTATVSSSGPAPTGTVTFKAGATTVCAAVALVSGQANCIVATLGAGSSAVTATYSGDAAHATSTGSLTQEVAKATATVTLVPGSLSATYDGAPKAASATTIPAGLAVTFTYAGSATAPTGAGGYAVVATVNDANYQGTASGTLTIAKAAATVTLVPASLSAAYDGTPKAAVATTSPAGLTVDLTYAGSASPPTLAGGYAVVATVNDANYQGTASGTLTIAKAAATVTLVPGSLSATYDGTPKAAVVTTIPAGLAVNVTYTGSATAPSGAGDYAVVATVNDANYQGTASGTLTIAKAAATVTLVPASLSVTYDGTSKAAAATTSPAGLTVGFTYAGSATAPTGAGDYAVVATVNDANHQGTASGTLTISKAAATVTLVPASLSVTYDGTSKAAAATTSPAGLTVAFTYGGSATAPTGAGDYAVVATVNDANHQGTASGTLTISKAAATVTLRPPRSPPPTTARPSPPPPPPSPPA